MFQSCDTALFIFYSLIDQTYQLTIPVMISGVYLNVQNHTTDLVKKEGSFKNNILTNRRTLQSTLIIISDSFKYAPEVSRTTNSHCARHISFVFNIMC